MEFRATELQRGSLIGGYRIDDLIGRGGMGMVYRATNIALNRIYALKVLAPAFAHDSEYRERFQREIRLAASLHHPNVVGVHYAGEHEGSLFVVMDFIDGRDLREVLLRTGALGPPRAVELLTQIAFALDAAHRSGLVHRDVKPANVLISVEHGEEHAYLTDFGLAKRSDAVSALTATGLVAGTVDYMSPEQITGGTTDARTDIYALGCVFFQMLTGDVPYTRDNSMAVLFAHVNDAPPAIEEPLAELYPAFGPVINMAMAKAPEDRYLSAGDFARDAAAALRGARYAGPPTSVATGEAEPGGAAEEPPAAAPAPAVREVDPQRTVISSRSSSHDTPQASGVQSATSHPRPPDAASGPGGQAGDSGPFLRRYRWPVLAALLAVAAAVAAIVVVTSQSSTPSSAPSAANLAAPLIAVPTNRVRASGNATLQLTGDAATVTITTRGLLNGSPHLMHIHAEGLGICPPASAARLHNGHLAISTGNGIQYYGPTQVSLTEFGSTSGAVPNNIDLNRYPATGDISYKRTVTITPALATLIREGNAVVIVHGIDYNGNHVYDFNALGVSDLDKTLPGEATAPAICGSLRPVAGANQRASRTSTFVASLAPDPADSSAGIPGIPAGSLLYCHIPGFGVGGSPAAPA
jgi:serine/threonine protein kinase